MCSLYLPEELVNLILEQLCPVSSLRFKSVCKSWNGILSGPGFLERRILLRPKRQKTYLAITKEIKSSYIILESPTSSTPTQFAPLLPFPKTRFYHVLVGSCRGIVCFADSWTGRCILWNPTTAESRLLPDHHPEGSIDRYRYKVGFNEYDGDLKIVKISSVQIDYALGFRYRAWIYELSSDSWREISSIGIDTGKKIPMCNARSSLTHCSWMAHRENIGTDVHAQCNIVSFDMATEAFTTFRLPMDIGISPKSCIPDLCLITLNGFLALCCFQNETPNTSRTQIWVSLKPGVVESWTKLWAIRHPTWHLHSPLEFWNGGLVIKMLKREDDGLVWCDLSDTRIQLLLIDSRRNTGVVAFERTHSSVASDLHLTLKQRLRRRVPNQFPLFM